MSELRTELRDAQLPSDNGASVPGADDPQARAARAPMIPACPVEQVIAAAIERLGQRLPPMVLVEEFPDRPEQYDFPSDVPAAVLVLHDGSRFEGRSLQGDAGETVRLMMTLLVRSLKGDNGARALLHEIRLALQGVSLAGSTGLMPVDVKLERENAGVFQYNFAFSCIIPALPVKPAGGVALPARR